MMLAQGHRSKEHAQHALTADRLFRVCLEYSEHARCKLPSALRGQRIASVERCTGFKIESTYLDLFISLSESKYKL